MVRDPQQASAIASLPNVALFTADFDDPASIASALDRASSAFQVTNLTERAEHQQLALGDVARRKGLSYIVKLSQLPQIENRPSASCITMRRLRIKLSGPVSNTPFSDPTSTFRPA